MRRISTATSSPWLVTFVLLGACLDSGQVIESRVRVVVEPSPSGRVLCFRVALFDDTGALALTSGGYDASSVAALRAGGAVCGTADGEGVALPCEPGAGEVSLELAGAFEAGGGVVHAAVDPCGTSGCLRPFECREGQETRVVYEHLETLSPADQGFLDMAVDLDPPPGASEMCIGLALFDGDGETYVEVPRLCSGEHGSGAGGDLAYVIPCNAEAPEHTLLLFVHDPAGVSWDNPCPLLGGGDAPSLWAGGCEQAVTCVTNRDVTVSFDFAAP